MSDGISAGSPSFNHSGTGTTFKPWVLPVVGAILCLACGTASGFAATAGPGEWYQHLVKPPGNPPACVFGPVWTVLYLTMGASAGILANHRAIPALSFFLFQLILNLLWTPVFFGAHHVEYALGIIVLMWAAILVTFHLASSVRPLAAWLLAPYLAWVSYATYLNAGIFVLNK